MTRFIGCAVVVGICLSAARAGDFAIRDGDTVVFLGDSITAEGSAEKVVEDYTLLRFPKRNVKSINAGVGGDTAAGGLKRLDRDVFERGATLLTVAYGINDIGWGGKADEEHRKLYLDSVRAIVSKCKEHGVRVFICSAAVTAADPDKSENDFLQKMCDEGMKISRDAGEGAIDLQRTMREIQRRIKAANAGEKDPKKHETLHAGDGIHLNDLGQLTMGFALVKGLGAPRDVSAATIDGDKVTSSGCKIDNLKHGEDAVEFDRLDEGLPLNFGLFAALKFRFVPIPEEINRYMLSVKNLAPGNYDITVDERGVGTFSAEDLARGVNLSSATADGWVPGGPWEAQAWLVNMLTNARNETAQTLKSYPDYLKHNPIRDEMHADTDSVIENMQKLQRKMAQPRVYHFVIRKK
jgi:lysophospholipase L1-like esterase